MTILNPNGTHDRHPSPEGLVPLSALAIARGSRALLAAAAAAVGALMAAGAAGALFMPPAPVAHAQIMMPDQGAPVTFADLVAKVKPAVVSVRVKQGVPRTRDAMLSEDSADPLANPQLDKFYRGLRGRRGAQGRNEGGPLGTSQGSGFLISADGYVVTNNHVVENGTEVSVAFDDGRSLKARIVGTDPKTDLALLQIEEKGSYPFVTFATKSPRVGDWVLAVGNPFGLGGTVTKGIVSARGRDIGAGPYDDYLQIDAAVNRGNSGGPTFDMAGNVVGINTAIVSPSGGSVGIAFAVSAEAARGVIADLKSKGSVSRGYIGVSIQPVTPEIAEALEMKITNGALVADIVRDGPAAKAGVKRGDVITGLNGEGVKDGRDLSRRIATITPGQRFLLNIRRGGREEKINVEAGRQGET